ncbi:hypothetical protein AQUCO_01100531v1 [Aquilegia coerulea]|uniref:Protein DETOXIFICATION n=1 Tax=Aquilegia coerulea TaxID=218851 RepID=A0A2G5E7I6_AQUCA|nr:hypothetical protein AQUCO_01100531v1 [Aquilegia coerulea]
MENTQQQQQPLLHREDDEEISNLVLKKGGSSFDSSLIADGDIEPIKHIKDFFREFLVESKKLWFLAGPAIFTSICQYSLGAISQVFAGQVGTLELAAVSVENSVIAGFSFGVMLGMGSALETLCGQAYGAGQIDMLGIYMQRSWVILNTTAILLTFLYIFAAQLLKLIGQEDNIAQAAGTFAIYMIPQLFAYAVNFPLAKFLQAQSKMMAMAVIAFAALIFHTFFSWLLMLKLGWGLVGAAVVLNLSWWLINAAQFLYICSGTCGRAWSGFSMKAFENLWGFVRLSIASAVMLCLEVWYFMALILFAGYLKNPEVSVDGLSICMNILGWTVMVAFGFNAATSVRVANELGAGHPRTAKFSVVVVVICSFVVGMVLSLILIISRKQYPYAFTSSPDVRKLVYQLTPLLAFSIVINNVQPVLSGVAIGAGWQTLVAYINIACYYIFGIPLGLILGYKLDLGVKGIWFGMITGTVVQTAILFFMTYRTNWNKEPLIQQEDDDHEQVSEYQLLKQQRSSFGSFLVAEGDIEPINHVKDFFKEFMVESRKLWLLAGPAIFTGICQYTLGAITQIFAGQLGTVELAAFSVENSVIAGFSFGIMFGMGSALETLCGQAYGAGQFDMLGIYMQRSWVILNTTAIILTFIYIFAAPLLKLIGQENNIAQVAGTFAVWMIPQLFAYAVNYPLARFLQAQSKVMVMAIIAFAVLLLHTFFSWLLMLKLGWGLVGAAVVLSASWWFINVAQLLYIFSGTCGRAWSGFSMKAFQNLWRFVRLSVTSAVMICLEVWYYMALILFAGYLKNPEVSVDGLSICINILGWAAMVAFGFNAATSVRVSNELGAGHPRLAKFSVMVVVIYSPLIAMVFSLILIISRKHYPYAFTSSPDVRKLVYQLTPLLSLSVVLNNVQPVLSGMAIGAGWQNVFVYANVGCYYVLGIPLGLILGYKLNMSVKGIWFGMLIGTTIQTGVLFLITYRKNWNK